MGPFIEPLGRGFSIELLSSITRVKSSWYAQGGLGEGGGGEGGGGGCDGGGDGGGGSVGDGEGGGGECEGGGGEGDIHPLHWRTSWSCWQNSWRTAASSTAWRFSMATRSADHGSVAAPTQSSTQKAVSHLSRLGRTTCGVAMG